MQKDLGYLKQELIEARAHKSASDDKVIVNISLQKIALLYCHFQLGNVSGKLETLENTITSLSDEGKGRKF